MIAVLLFILTSCGCEHEYDDGKITKEPTCTEEGEKTFTCEFCGDSYTEAIPVRDDEVAVTVLSKTNLETDYNVGRYSERVEFTFEF